MLDGLFDFIGGGVIPIFAIIIVVVLIVSYIGSRYKVAGANEALIVSGQRDKSPDGRRNLKVVRGGGVIVLPLIHKVGKLKLTARQINVNLADAVTRQGIKVAVQGVATFKIGADDESIRNAAERFLESQEEAVDSIVKNVLEGSLRSIVGTLTVEELNLDRMKFQQAVQDAAKGDLATSGLQIDSFTIQAIRDESGYMELIGQQETARRERDARMAKASADQEAAVREAEAEQVKINASRDVALRRAETETQTAAAQARAAQAGPLAEAEATQEVTRKQTELAQLEAARKEQELVATTVRPAEADAAAQIRRAEGAKGARHRPGPGRCGAGQARRRGAGARRRGDRRGRPPSRRPSRATPRPASSCPRARRRPRPSPCAPRPTASSTRRPSSRPSSSQLPDIVRAAAEPMGNIDHLTVLSNDGASDMVKNVTRTVTEAGATVKGLTGIDIPEMLSQAMGGAGAAARQSGSGGSKTRPPSGPKSGGSGSGTSTTGGAASASGGSATAGAATGGASASTTTAAPSAGSAGQRRPTSAGTAAAALHHARIGGRGDRRRRAGRPCGLGAARRRAPTRRPARRAGLDRPRPPDHPRDDRRRRRDPAGGRPSRRARHRALRRRPPRRARAIRSASAAHDVADRPRATR